MTVGERIKALRIGQGQTQEALADKTGTTKQTIHKYESGIITNIPIDRIQKIANALGVTAACLMGWAEPSPLLTQPAKDNILKLIERDGTYIERKLSDEQTKVLKTLISQLPEDL